MDANILLCHSPKYGEKKIGEQEDVHGEELVVFLDTGSTPVRSIIFISIQKGILCMPDYTVIIAILLLVLFLIAFIVPLPVIVTMFSDLSEYSETSKKYDTYVVLGNKLHKGKPSYDMKMRMNYLMKVMMNSTKGFHIILTGLDREVYWMYRMLYDNFSEDFLHKFTIELDKNSTNTINSIEYLVGNNVNDCAIITSEYHTYRTNIICKKLELNCNVIPVYGHKVTMWKYLLEAHFALITAVFSIRACKEFSKTRIKLHLK